MIPERVPGEFGNEPMVLVSISRVMCKNEIGIQFCLEAFKDVFDPCTLKGHKSISKLLDLRPAKALPCEEPGGSLRFIEPNAVATEDYPMKFDIRIIPRKAKD
jgi:hypothetical protein